MIIDIPTVDGGDFIDGSPNKLGTIVTAKFLNSVKNSSTATTKEIETILKNNVIAPDSRVHDQLFKAISKMITDKQVSITSTLGASKTIAASQFLANELNKAIVINEKAINQTNDKLNAKQDKLTFVGTGETVNESVALIFRGRIEKVNCNNIKKMGLYIIRTNADAETIENLPVPRKSFLSVYEDIINHECVQEVFDYQGERSFRRTYYALRDLWSDWFEDVNSSDIVQTTGASENKIMSQKAVTDATCALGDEQTTPTYALHATFGDNMSAALTTVPRNAVVTSSYSEKWPAAAVRYRPIIRTGG